MSNTRYIAAEAVSQWFKALVAHADRVMAPTMLKKGIDFMPVTRYDQVVATYVQTTQSPKSVVFPRVEPILSYTVEGKNVDMDKVDDQSFPSTILWGAHPCDSHAIANLKAVFMDERVDVQFAARYAKLSIIGLACTTADDSCFCTSVGISNQSPMGSDIMLHPLKNGGYKVDVVTEKGQKLIELNPSLFTDTSTDETMPAAAVPLLFDLEKVRNNLKNGFEHPYWHDSAHRCHGCGTCAFICPACSCFDIQDEKRGNKGVRLRCWDSCAMGLFTLHTSGHNPREEQSQRWRQRIMHKFSYIPAARQNNGCTGCGRCSRACPADMNLPEHLKAIESWSTSI